VVPTKNEVILNLPVPKTHKDVRNFLGHVGYYRCFIEIFTIIVSPLFIFLSKDNFFLWTM
jgi:hypothetical protein